jgi:hypothetical protein
MAGVRAHGKKRDADIEDLDRATKRNASGSPR